MLGCCHVAAPIVIQVYYEPTTKQTTPFFFFTTWKVKEWVWNWHRKELGFKGKEESKTSRRGALKPYPASWLVVVQKHTGLCAQLTGTFITNCSKLSDQQNLPYFRKVADFPPTTSRQTSTTVRSWYLPLHAQSKHQHGRRAKPPSVLLPLQPRLKSPLKRRCKRRLLKGVPKPWSEDLRGRLEGIPASRPGVTPRLGEHVGALPS